MIVVAMAEETKLLDISKEPVLITGIGALNVINALQGLDRNTPIINIGYAGSNKLPIGTRVLVGEVKLYHPNAEYPENVKCLSGNTPCYTSCDFVTSTDIEEPCVFDMELAFILALGFKDVTAVKVVSDNLSVEQFDEHVKGGDSSG